MPETQKRRFARKRSTEAPAEDDFGRLQPQAIDLEQAVLGALMIERDAYSMVSDILKPDSFYERRNQLVFNAIQSLAFAQKPIDILTVREQLKTSGDLEDVGGPFYIAQLTQKMTSTAHLVYHANIIAQKYMLRQLISYTSNIQGKAFDETQDADELMQEAEGKLFQLSQQNTKKEYTQIDPVIDEAYNVLRKAAARNDGLSGIALVILAARPAMGKTAFALSMAKNIAVDSKTPVAFFSLEMSNVQLVNRLIINVCEIPGEKLKSGQLAPYEWVQLDQSIKKLYGAPLYIDDTPSLSIFELRTKARRLVREHQVGLIMIDYLQLMNASGMNFGSRQEEVSNISRALKQLAKELNIPILALSQLNRGVETRQGNEGKRPQLSDLRESGAIEQDADIVCFIHRPEYYHIYEDNGKDMHGMAEIIIAKHRNGAVGDVVLRFKAQFARFQNPDDDIISSSSDSSAYSPVTGNETAPQFPGAVNVPPPTAEDDPFTGIPPTDDAPPF